MSSTLNTRSTPKVCFEEASQALAYLGVKTSGDFFRLCRLKLRPTCIPARPDFFYKEQFNTWEQFLTIGSNGQLSAQLKNKIDKELEQKNKTATATNNADDKPTKSAKSGSRSIPKVSMQQAAVMLVGMGVDSSTLLVRLIKERKRPAEIPSRPDLYYAEFKGWDEFFDLGREGIKQSVKIEKPILFDDLCVLVAKLNIHNKLDFKKAIKDGRLPNLTPSMPDQYYAKEWVSWKEFLAPKAFYLCFEEARQIARSLKFENRYQWVTFCRSGKLPEFIPKSPDREYEEFTTWADFLKG